MKKRAYRRLWLSRKTHTLLHHLFINIYGTCEWCGKLRYLAKEEEPCRFAETQR